jgi:hypothetical protein
MPMNATSHTLPFMDMKLPIDAKKTITTMPLNKPLRACWK